MGIQFLDNSLFVWQQTDDRWSAAGTAAARAELGYYTAAAAAVLAALALMAAPVAVALLSIAGILR